MGRDVREVANAILKIAETEGFQLTNMSLNKIVYFAHAWSLAIHHKPLVDSSFEAWQYGPVHPQLYRQLKRFGDQTITGRLTRINLEDGSDIEFDVNLDKHDENLIRKITLFYGNYSASRLVQISHERGAPWDQVWSGSENGVCLGMVIPDSMTELFYANKLRSRS